MITIGFTLRFVLFFQQLSTTPISDGFLDIETDNMEYNNTCELPVKLFADTLQSLNLSNNLIDDIPQTLYQLKALAVLDLSKLVNGSFNTPFF